MKTSRIAQSRGYALLSVLLVLFALLVLCAPFLFTARQADRAGARAADGRAAGLALDGALRHARAHLAASHPALDATPYFDSAAELAVEERFPPELLDPADPRGVMWAVEARDESGLADLNSAPPALLANLMERATFLVRPAAPEDAELAVGGTYGFGGSGFLLVAGELVRYASAEGSRFVGLTRGLGARADDACGPRPPLALAAGEPVIDLLAWDVALRRTLSADGELVRWHAPEELERLHELSPSGAELDPAALAALARGTSVWAGVAAGPVWQRAARLTTDVRGGRDCTIRVDEGRWFNPGTTVRVSDPQGAELRLVVAVRAGTLVLSSALARDYRAFEAEVRALARRPVNVNSAPPEVLLALFRNLKLAGANERITRGEAEALVEVLVASRPFAGFEDFLRRVVLPAAGLAALPEDAPVVPARFAADGAAPPAPFLDREDAVALYRNAQNANDAALEVSTLPLAFGSRDVYELELRASINAASGAERASRVRSDVELCVPQTELLRLWTRQEDFDEELRLACEAPLWMSGPAPTSVFDVEHGATPPPRAPAHLALADPLVAERGASFFATRAEDGFVQPWPARADDSVAPGVRHALHFDLESSDLEGRFLPEEPIRLDPRGAPLSWSGTGLCEPLFVSLWVRPKSLAAGELLDLGAGLAEADRVSLAIEGAALVLRVLDGAGDHTGTAGFVEAGEVRVPLEHVPLDVWTHLAFDVRGNRPEQLALLVDGFERGETSGLTRLTQGVDFDDGFLPVESTDGFPARCVLRIGTELVEAFREPAGFRAQPAFTGPDAGFGGRMAREHFTLQGTSVPDLATNDAFQAAPGYAVHAAGTAVALHGYSLPLASNVPAGSARLPADIGRFAVARAAGVQGEGPENKGQRIVVTITLGSGQSGAVELGRGLDDLSTPEILLEPVPGEALSLAEVMRAFNPGGGYALLAQRDIDVAVTGNPTATVTGPQLSGLEVVEYSGWSGNRLRVSRRGALVTELAEAGAPGQRAFVFNWSVGQKDKRLGPQTFVIPISLPAQGGGGPFGLLPALGPGSELAQLTRLGSDAALTEWVRYDEIVTSSIAGEQLVRSSGAALERARQAAVAGATVERAGVPAPAGGAGPGGGGPGAPAPVGAGTDLGATATVALLVPALVAPQVGAGTTAWSFELGTHAQANPTTTTPVTLAVATHLEFRGVAGTYAHEHPAGTEILPVWRAARGADVFGGRPGRHDAVTLFGPDPSDLGEPAFVQHAWQTQDVTVTTWKESGSTGVLATIAVGSSGLDPNAVYVALQDPLAIPVAPAVASAVALASGVPGPSADERRTARVVLFPSGELPRGVSALALGGDHLGATGAPAVVVDEVLLGSAQFTGGTGRLGVSLVLAAGLSATDDALVLVPDTVRAPLGTLFGPNALLELPSDAGCLRIGAEILGYDAFDAATGQVRVATAGRGLLGTEPAPHEAGESVVWLEHQVVSALAAGIGAGEAALPIAAPAGFPPAGTVLVRGELVHYTRRRANALEMPRLAPDPADPTGAPGDGLFRGRYGTGAAAHAAGELVLLFPFRYWDRFAPRADAPELAYFGFALEQPGAYWTRCFWEAEEPGLAGVSFGLLARSDARVPWDADPERVPGLASSEQVAPGSGRIELGRRADRLEWRAFTRYSAGAFDLAGGAHGWKSAPRLHLLGAECFAPTVTLARIER